MFTVPFVTGMEASVAQPAEEIHTSPKQHPNIEDIDRSARYGLTRVRLLLSALAPSPQYGPVTLPREPSTSIDGKAFILRQCLSM